MDREEAINVVKCNWPEGRHQLSEALKTLIPELQESEDERISKWLIDYFKSVGKFWIHRDISPEQILAYLERQKEYIEDIRQYAYNKGLVDAEEKQKPLSTEETELNSIAFLEQLGYACVPPRAEQKPAEWSEEDKEVLKKVFECIRFAEDHYQLEEEQANGVSVKSWLLDHINPQPHWKPSDKQLSALERCLDYLDESDNEDAAAIGSLCRDLKNL